MRDRARRRKFKKEFKPTFKLSKLGMIISLVAIVFVLSLLYLSQSNKMATSGYDIAKLERERNELKLENERLMIESSRLQSIQNIEAGVKSSDMVPVKQINYIPASSDVAVNIK